MSWVASASARAAPADEDAFVRASEAREAIVASFCHDMRQPLNAALLRVDSLIDDLREPEARRLLLEVRANLEELSSTGEAVFDAIRLSRNAIPVRSSSVSLARVLLRLKLVMEDRARAKGLRIHFRSNHLVAEIDEWLLMRILENLVSNSVKFTHSGWILVVCRASAKGLTCHVWDSGPGVSRAIIDALEANRVASVGPWQGGTVVPSSTGLGLRNTKAFAELLGGALAIRSTPGKGARVQVAFPCPVYRQQSSDRAYPHGLDAPRAVLLSGDEIPGVPYQQLFVREGWTCDVVDEPLRFISRVIGPGTPVALAVIPYRHGAIKAEFLVRILLSRLEQLKIVVLFPTELAEDIDSLKRWNVRIVVGDLSAAVIDQLWTYALTSSHGARQ